MISGYAAVFYDPSDPGTEFDLGEGYVERILPGAFDDALASGADVVCLLNHDPNLILGRRSANSLQLEVDRRGLRYSASEAGTAIYRDVAMWQAHGELRGSSFGFKVTKQRFATDGAKRVREILAVQLLDVGPVTFPAYAGTGDGVLRRSVSPEGRCYGVPADHAAETRSAICAGLAAVVRERERRAVEVRARRVRVDT